MYETCVMYICDEALLRGEMKHSHADRPDFLIERDAMAEIANAQENAIPRTSYYYGGSEARSKRVV